MEEMVQKLAKHLRLREWKLATAESCTGGGLAYQLTEIAGSSDWFERGFITYSNLAKIEMLGVKSQTLDTEGAVSEATAREMAEGALSHSQAQLSVAITGIAGPSGGSKTKPVGTVWFAWSGIDVETFSKLQVFSGDRHKIRTQAILSALEELLRITQQK